MKKFLRIYSLNVGGLCTKFDLGFLHFTVDQYDIICFSETKTNFIENVKFDGFKVFDLTRENESHRYGGIHGLCIFVREEIYDFFSINLSSEYFLGI